MIERWQPSPDKLKNANQTMAEFLDRQRRLDDHWRAVILFGRNVASYKFALGQSLLELSARKDSLVRMEELAVPFARHIVQHLKTAPKQATSASSRFLETCRKAGNGEISEEDLIRQTVNLGFNNVIDAFHIVNQAEIPVRFFVDERRGAGGIRLTDEFFRLRETNQFASLPNEVQARWRLVETAWELSLPRGLVIGVEGEGETMTVSRAGRRAPVARSRDALNGYQKGKCFYCFSDVTVAAASTQLADVDHFFPRMLLQTGERLSIDGVWNLVLSCRTCNRGIDGKSARLPERTLLARLNTRNEFLIRSHHPLRETLIAQTGKTPDERARFLNSVYDASWGKLIHTWKPKVENEAAF